MATKALLRAVNKSVVWAEYSRQGHTELFIRVEFFEKLRFANIWQHYAQQRIYRRLPRKSNIGGGKRGIREYYHDEKRNYVRQGKNFRMYPLD